MMTTTQGFGQHDDEGPLTRHRRGPTPRLDARAALVIGWNRHADSVTAVRYAAGLARLLDAHLHVVHIVDLDDEPLDPDAPNWEEQFDATVDDAALEARRILDAVPASWTYHSGHGSAAELLATVSDRYGALMVVIGSPRGGFMSYVDSVVGQSVARRMLGQRRVPLLVVPSGVDVDTVFPGQA